MEAEERPTKIRKLSHDERTQGRSGDESMLQCSAENVDKCEEQAQKNDEQVDSADVTVFDNSSHNISESPGEDPVDSPSTSTVPPSTSQPTDTSTLSKSQLKKLRKKQEWEAGREERKLIRKQKNQEKKARKRAERDAAPTNDEELRNGDNSNHPPSLRRPGVPKHVTSTLLPISLIIDCSFDSLMHERERISLGSQITRSYSDNHRARFRAHLAISSWGGELKERFDTVLHGHYKNWKGVKILEEGFAEAAEKSREWMAGEKGGRLAGAFAKDVENGKTAEELAEKGDIVYLTSDSPHTLDRLKPYSTYIIGGLVDKNRHKGICYKRAGERGIETAKLPIGEYMDMQSRYVLATNHVVEIMLRWLECGDWGEAFFKVIPKRKGGKLKEKDVEGEEDQEESRVDEVEDVNGEEEEEHETAQSSDELNTIHDGQKVKGQNGEDANKTTKEPTAAPLDGVEGVLVSIAEDR